MSLNNIIAVEPAVDPGARPTFLIDWELTLKCNLDCTYCASGPDGYHWNASKHPPKEDCFASIDFMLEYADLYMQYKPKWSKAVVVNVYGGESLYHPDIIEILKRLNNRAEDYKDRWPLKITCTTNLLVTEQKLSELLPLIDEFTVSYHSETTDKQKKNIIDNILFLKQHNKDQKVIVLMHSDYKKWPEILNVIDFCKEHNIKYLAKQLDGDSNSNYNQQQLDWFKKEYTERTSIKSQVTQNDLIATSELNNDTKSLSKSGRSCCGGRSLCVNENLKTPVTWIPDNNFYGWSCSVNWFFVYIRQFTNDIYVNKDCRMSFNNRVEPIGNIKNYQLLLDQTKNLLENNSMPTIQCKRTRCVCGLCAPKSLTKEGLHSIMNKHITHDVFEK